MRVDVPYDLPRRPSPQRQIPMEPSPLERRREALAAQAKGRQVLSLPKVTRRGLARQREERSRSRILDRTLQADRREDRDRLPLQAIGLSLRAEEQTLLREVGRFRVIATSDLAKTVYQGRDSRMERDIRFLRNQGLVGIDSVNARRDGRGGRTQSIEVVTLTREGRNIARNLEGVPQDQQLYAGMVKPREVEHDTQIYRAYLKEAERIEREGGQNLRVRLDFELKSQVQKAIYAARKASPERDLTEIKQQVAAQHELPFVNNTIQIPDARIEYELDQGSRTGHADVEVLTAAYRPGHLRSKAQAGFHAYASAADRTSLTGKIEDDHGLMQDILEL